MVSHKPFDSPPSRKRHSNVDSSRSPRRSINATGVAQGCQAERWTQSIALSLPSWDRRPAGGLLPRHLFTECGMALPLRVCLHALQGNHRDHKAMSLTPTRLQPERTEWRRSTFRIKPAGKTFREEAAARQDPKPVLCLLKTAPLLRNVLSTTPSDAISNNRTKETNSFSEFPLHLPYRARMLCRPSA